MATSTIVSVGRPDKRGDDEFSRSAVARGREGLNARSRPVADIASASAGAQCTCMKSIVFMGMVAALLPAAIVAHVRASPLAPQVGDTYEITRTRESAQQGGRSSGSSHDKDTIVERVTA